MGANGKLREGAALRQLQDQQVIPNQRSLRIMPALEALMFSVGPAARRKHCFIVLSGCQQEDSKTRR